MGKCTFTSKNKFGRIGFRMKDVSFMGLSQSFLTFFGDSRHPYTVMKVFGGTPVIKIKELN